MGALISTRTAFGTDPDAIGRESIGGHLGATVLSEEPEDVYEHGALIHSHFGSSKAIPHAIEPQACLGFRHSFFS